MDNELFNFGLRAFVMLFAIVNPFGNVPIFATVTQPLAGLAEAIPSLFAATS